MATTAFPQSIPERFAAFWNGLRRETVHAADGLYAPDVIFADPAHELSGLPALKEYLTRLYANVNSCQFRFERVLEGPGEAMLTWTMTLRHPRLAGGAPVQVPGASFVRHDLNLIHHHRDYFDLGALLYEHVPLLGGVVRGLKHRL